MKCPLVLISGLLSNEFLWQHQVAHLKEIASTQIFSPNQNSVEKMIEAILEKAPAKFALAGHSMGGWLCLELMRVAPSRISKICLLNTSAQNDSLEKKTNRYEMISRVKKGHFEEVVEEVATCFVHHPFLKDGIKKMFVSVGQEAFVRQEEAMINRGDIQPVLSTITCPTLVIHAAQDKNFSLQEHQELVAKIPNARLAIIENSGHMSPLEMPQAVTKHLRFWLTS